MWQQLWQKEKHMLIESWPDLIWSVLQLSVLAGLLLEHEVWVWFLVLVSVPGKRRTVPESYSKTCLGHVTAQPRVQLFVLFTSAAGILH